MPNKDDCGALERRVAYASWAFWMDNKDTLLRHGQDWKDVRQQAWVEALCLQKECPANPTKYLYARLVSWHRRCSKFNKRRRKPAPFMDSIECCGEPGQERQDSKWPPRVDPVDFEMGEMVQRVRAEGRYQGARTEYIVDAFIEGSTLEEIGRACQVSGSRVCQILRKVVQGVKASVVVACLCVMPTLLANAQTPAPEISDCAAVTWQNPADPDLKSVFVYVAKDGAVPAEWGFNAFDSTGAPLTSLTCDQLGIVAGGSYSLHMTAVDTAGNESVPSNTLTFSWPMGAIAPPSNVCLDVMQGGVSTSLCASP